MNLTKFLEFHGTDLPSVISAVDRNVNLLRNDVLLAVGSVAEGFGNKKSDLDLLLITPREGTSLPVHDEYGIVINKCLIDVRILPKKEVDDLLRKLHAVTEGHWDVTHAIKMTVEQRTLLHRLYHGQLINTIENEHRWEVSPSLSELLRLKLHVARHEARTVQVDLVGYRDSGDYRTLVHSAQHLLGQAIDALTACFELTNPVSKWRFRLLDQLPDHWIHRFVLRGTADSASEYYWKLHSLPAYLHKEGALEYALRIVSFARSIFIGAEIELIERSFPRIVLQNKVGSSNLSRNNGPTLLPALEFDVDYKLIGEKAILGRINEMAQMVTLTTQGLAIAILHDGVTTVGEAAMLALGSESQWAVDFVHSTSKALEEAGLLFRAS